MDFKTLRYNSSDILVKYEVLPEEAGALVLVSMLPPLGPAEMTKLKS